MAEFATGIRLVALQTEISSLQNFKNIFFSSFKRKKKLVYSLQGRCRILKRSVGAYLKPKQRQSTEKIFLFLSK